MGKTFGSADDHGFAKRICEGIERVRTMFIIQVTKMKNRRLFHAEDKGICKALKGARYG